MLIGFVCFFAQHFRSMLPFRFYVRCLLRAIARTGAVLLSTGHRPQFVLFVMCA